MTTEIKDLSKFFPLAKKDCCNYSLNGPNGKKHFCWLEPYYNNNICLLNDNLICQWFLEAVLVHKKNIKLQDEWNKLFNKPSKLIKKQCEGIGCKSKIVVTSNRIKYCDKCSKKAARERTRKSRLKKVQV